jgi:PKD repeat protein
MKPKSNLLLSLLTFFMILFAFNSLGIGQANVSRSSNWKSVSPRIAVDSAGNLHVVWAEYYTDPPNGTGDAFYSKYDISTSIWSPPINLSNSSLVNSREYRPVGIDVDGANNVYVVYIDRTAIKLRVYSGGSWGSPFEISSHTEDIDMARIAVDPSGNIFTCWWTIGSGIVWSRARIGGTWEAGVRISPAQRCKFPNIAVGNNVVFATWQESGYAEGYQASYVQRSKSFNASWSSSQRVAVTNDTITPEVEIDGNDIAHIIWEAKTINDPSVWDFYVFHSYWTGNGFSPPQNIASPVLLLYPQVHERGNNLYVCWSVGGWSGGIGVRANNRINGVWVGESSVPNSGGSTYTDVSTSPAQDRVYFVWDDFGSAGSKEIWCNMGATGPPPPPPDTPVALFSFSPSSGPSPLKVSFDGSASYDPNGTITAYNWNFGDGSTGSGQRVEHTYNSAGSYTVTLTVTDNSGKSGSTSHTVAVIKPNDPPIAEFSFSPVNGIAPLDVTFDASASRDPDGYIALYSWTFGDGGTGSGKVVTYRYNQAGTFSVRLTVRDDAGASAFRTKTVEVFRLYPPLNISWTTHADQSLFQTRYVTEVTWEKNPENDKLGVQIALHRIYRKKVSESNSAYRVIGEVTGATYRYLDKNVGGKNLYSYTVTVIDDQGRESPIASAAGSFHNLLLNKRPQGIQKKGKLSGN